jgi:hypothetical protein
MRYRSNFEKSLACSVNSRGFGFKYEPWSLAFTKPMRMTKKLKEAHGLPKDFSSETYHLYTPDFLLPSGVIVEAKGKFTAQMRTIMINVVRCNPELDIRMCFQRDNRIHPGSKTRYSDWCNQNKIAYAVGIIPTSWCEP